MPLEGCETKAQEKACWINDQFPNNNCLYLGLGAYTEPGVSQPHSFLELFLFGIRGERAEVS